MKKNKYLKCIYVPPLWFSISIQLSYLIIGIGTIFLIVLIVKRKKEKSKPFTKFSKIMVILIILSVIWLVIASFLVERKLSEKYYNLNPVDTWATESIFSGGCR